MEKKREASREVPAGSEPGDGKSSIPTQNMSEDTPPSSPTEETPPTPRPPNRQEASLENKGPPQKKYKTTPMKTPRPGLGGSPQTPRIWSSRDDSIQGDAGKAVMQGEDSSYGDDDSNHPRMTMSDVFRRRSISSSPSESSFSSGFKEGSRSPIAPYVPEVPPAPPSTPASDLKRPLSPSQLEGMSTPLPYAMAVKNAAQLERQQKFADGVATPAPTKSTSNKTDDVDEGGKHGPLTNDFSGWAVSDRYKLVRMLGRGSYGEVAQALDLHRGNASVAIKRIQSPFDQEVDAVRLFREIHILRRVKGHECVIDLLDVIQPPTDDLNDFNDLYLVFEYVDTDLYKLIMSPQYLTTEHIQTFLYQMLIGLKYIHSASVIHRDLKPANILLNEDCSLKICDFGLARIVESDKMRSATREQEQPGRETRPPDFRNIKRAPLTRQLTKHVVTRWYRAPELILIQPYTSAVDIWSLGCILAELLSMQEGSVPGYQDRTPLFPGGTCYPLSGESGLADERLDQLSVIFGVIGTPSAEDVAAIGKANEYIKTLGNIHPKKGFKDRFPAADAAALDLLDKMLKFNPERRCTADEALDHEFFQGVRRKEMERTAGEQLIGPSFLDAIDIDMQTLKQKTYEEVAWYKDQPVGQPATDASHPAGSS